MKLVKLIAIFLLVVGAVIGVLFIPKDGGHTPFQRIDLTGRAGEICQQIEEAWCQQSQWDDSLFHQHERIIGMNRSSDVITLADATSLHQLLRELSLSCIDSTLTAEYSRRDCHRAFIDRGMKGVDTLCARNRSYASDARVERLRRCYSTYTDILSFVNRSFSASVNLQPAAGVDNTHTWYDYAAFMTQQKKRANDYLADNTYSTYLKNITELSQGLAGIDAKLNTECGRFCQSLANALSTAYGRIADADVSQQTVNHFEDDSTRYYRAFRNTSSEALRTLRQTGSALRGHLQRPDTGLPFHFELPSNASNGNNRNANTRSGNANTRTGNANQRGSNGNTSNRTGNPYHSDGSAGNTDSRRR